MKADLTPLPHMELKDSMTRTSRAHGVKDRWVGVNDRVVFRKGVDKSIFGLTWNVLEVSPGKYATPESTQCEILLVLIVFRAHNQRAIHLMKLCACFLSLHLLSSRLHGSDWQNRDGIYGNERERGSGTFRIDQ